MKKARLIGKTELIDTPAKMNLWSCSHCDNLFNAEEDMNGKEIECPTCKKKLILEYSIKQIGGIKMEEETGEDEQEEQPEEVLDD